MAWPYFLALLAYVLVDATAQGGITLRNRQYVPMAEQPAVSRDHHLLMPLLYALLAAVVAAHFWRLEWLGMAALLRLALFDPTMNLRKGDPLFAVGESAATDRLLARLGSGGLAALRVGALAGAVALLLYV